MELFQQHYTEEQLRAVPTLTLAHIGDSVYELLARTAVVNTGVCRVEDAHRSTVSLVSAPAQARAAEQLLPQLTEWEMTVFRHGRNAHFHSVPKHCTLREYAYATGLEALLGALYLTGQRERIAALWALTLEALHA